MAESIKVEAATAADERACVEALSVRVVPSPEAYPVSEEPSPEASKEIISEGPPQEVAVGPILPRLACGPGRGRLVGYNSPESVFNVETDAFVGRIYLRYRGLPNEPNDGYFAMRKTPRMSAVVQGRFKRAGLKVSDCATGYEFEQPFAYVPARMVVRAALKVLAALAPTAVIDLLGPRPYVLNPMFQTIQVLDVAEAGSEPPITAVLDEQTRLLGGVFAERPVGSAERKRYFSSRAHGERHAIDPAHVYTMEFSEDKVDAKTFEGLILGMRFQLQSYLGNQPLPYTLCKVGFVPFSSDDLLFGVHLHHERQRTDAVPVA